MIRHGKYEDISQFKSLWKQAFGDEDEYRDDFFLRVFCPEYTLCEEQDGIITAMLYKIPCEIRTDNDTEDKAYYFYALATEKCSRGKGIMGRLIAAAKKEIFAQGCRIVFLIPAEAGLAEYYTRFQFQPIRRICAYYMGKTGNSGGELIAASYSEDGFKESIDIEKVDMSKAEIENAAELMGRRWTYTNCNVSFPKEVESFCLDWMLREKESCFYKLVSHGEIFGFLQGKIENQIFNINYYGMERPCWKELDCAGCLEDFSGIQVLSFENPDTAGFSYMGSEEDFLISVCAHRQVKGIHGVIPV